MSRKSRRLAKAQAQPKGRDLSAEVARVNGNPIQRDQTGSRWMGPSAPLAPQAPPEVAGRILDFPVGYNLSVAPRAYEATGFTELRALSEAFEILNLAIGTRKDQMERLSWAIQPRHDALGDAATSDDDPVIGEITDFLEYPDIENDWGTWLRQVLDETLVTDALSIYTDHTAGGDLLSLTQIDGARIKRVIDNYGRTPAWPLPAYQEVLKGMDAVNYTTRDLLYMPRNKRVHKIYGFSCVEQVRQTVTLALLRNTSLMQYWTEGNIPEALCGVPDDWNPDQISKFQNWWDALLAGDTGARRHMRFVPGGVAKTFVTTKDPELWAKFDEWLARIVCYSLSIPPTPFINQVNRATAQSAHDAALEEGLAPLQNFIKRLIDRVIRDWWPAAAKKVEFAWADDREVDPLVQEQTLTSYVKSGLYTVNEARDLLGKSPDPDGNKLRVLISTGFVNIGGNDDAPTAGEAADTKQKAAEAMANNPAPVIGAPAATAAPKEAQAAKLAKGSDDQERDEQGRWTSTGANAASGRANIASMAAGERSGGKNADAHSAAAQAHGEAAEAMRSVGNNRLATMHEENKTYHDKQAKRLANAKAKANPNVNPKLKGILRDREAAAQRVKEENRAAAQNYRDPDAPLGSRENPSLGHTEKVEEAQAAKSAAPTFRKRDERHTITSKAYWTQNKTHRHEPPHQGGEGG